MPLFRKFCVRPIRTDHWQAARKGLQAPADAALSAMTIVEAANAEQEALAVAVVLREAADGDGTAALVTPDRALAARVRATLERWEVPVDNSGGDSLADTPAGLFARLTAEVALGGLAPVPLLALLKHPLLRLGAPANAHRHAVAALERAVLRGPRPKPGIAGLTHALETYRADRDGLHRNDPRKLVSDSDLAAAETLVTALGAALAPLNLTEPSLALATLAQRHRDGVIALASDAAKETAAFGGNDGKALALAFEEIVDSPAAAGLAIAPGDYAELFHAALATRIVRMREQKGVRIRIFGPLEARLQSIDRLVLGGLNEGSWPPDVRSDPWLSRPMRLALGLDLPERRVGLAAHDFAQALGAKELVLTRAAKSAGAPTVASRFLQRMAALAGAERWAEARNRGEDYLALAEALDAPAGKPQPMERPEPSPPLEARPHQLSVTDIENWLRDPYTIYAKHVLRLHPLEAVDTPPGVADRGSVIHEAIGNFTKAIRRRASGRPGTGTDRARPAEFRASRRLSGSKGVLVAALPAHCALVRRLGARAAATACLRAWRNPRRTRRCRSALRRSSLSARADRIERREDGAYAILDYKTGQPPTEPQVRTGLAPQLTLEAAILRGGGFAKAGVPAGSVAEISYVRLKGSEPAGENQRRSISRTKALRIRLPTSLRRSSPASPPNSSSTASPIARWCTRCGRSITATTIISPASRNGRPPAARARSTFRGRHHERRAHHPGRRAQPADRSRRSRALGVCFRQCRLRQDARAGATRGQSAAARHRAGKNPLHHLHQGGRRQHGDSRVRHACRLDRARRRSARSEDQGQHRESLRRAAARRARRLFATALETPGGLKVQTIHAFCTRLLHQFPFEADVAARFEVLDDAATSQLLNDLTLEVMLRAAADPDGALGQALAVAITTAADITFKEVIAEAIGKRDLVTAWVARAGGVQQAIDELSRTFGLAPGDGLQAVENEYLSASLIPQSEWPALSMFSRQGRNRTRTAPHALLTPAMRAGRDRVDCYLDIFCRQDRGDAQRHHHQAVGQEDFPQWATD